MKIDDNGTIRDMTTEEVTAYESMMAEMPKPTPSAEERLASVEAALRDLMLRGVNPHV